MTTDKSVAQKAAEEWTRTHCIDKNDGPEYEDPKDWATYEAYLAGWSASTKHLSDKIETWCRENQGFDRSIFIEELMAAIEELAGEP